MSWVFIQVTLQKPAGREFFVVGQHDLRFVLLREGGKGPTVSHDKEHELREDGIVHFW